MISGFGTPIQTLIIAPTFAVLDRSLNILRSLHFTVELQWLEHLWNNGNLFEIWIVQATEVNHGARSGKKWR